MVAKRIISVVGCHAEVTTGDVITGGVLPPAGDSMMDKKLAFERDHDDVRRLLICEPRGSVARHVNLIVPSTRDDCAAGAIVMEPTEYPPMSGSNTMCIATVLLETGVIPMVEPETRFRLDMPAGPVDIVAECRGGKCVSVTLKNVPAFAFALDATLEMVGSSPIQIDIAYGGRSTQSSTLPHSVSRSSPTSPRYRSARRADRMAAREQHPVSHPSSRHPEHLDRSVRRPADTRRQSGQRSQHMHRFPRRSDRSPPAPARPREWLCCTLAACCRSVVD